MKRKIHIKICFCILFIFITVTPISLAKEEIQFIEKAPLEETKIIYKTSIINNKRLLAGTEFDLRTRITIPVKNQKNTQECWAFSTATCLETNIALLKNQVFDFSERHIEYSTARYFVDGQNQNGHNRRVGEGGNALLAMAYFTSGRGPIAEDEMPFSSTEGEIYLHEIEGKTVLKKVTDFIEFPSVLKIKDDIGNITYTNGENPSEDIFKTYTSSDVEQIRTRIKQHIMNYGSVTAMTISGAAYTEYYNYDLDYPAFYCDNPDFELNHQVSIIGWDDNYSIENFNEEHRPSNPGAYLILNSYGKTGNFQEGCYYISYEDAYIEFGVIGVIAVENIDYDNIYQYDPLGISSCIHSRGNNLLYGANVFSKHKDSIEQLNEISIANKVEQNVEVYVNSEDGDLTTEKLKKVEIENNIIRQGYTTIKFKNPVELKGEKFAVVVKFMGGNKDAYIGIESANQSNSYWGTATSNKGESFFSTNMSNWTDLNDEFGNTNICIKAFTTKIGYNINSETYKVKEDIIYRIPSNTKVEDLKNNLGLIVDTKVMKNKVELEPDDIISTGATVLIDNKLTYKLIVTGDVNGQGDISITDLTKVKLHCILLETLNDIEKIAGDTNDDGDVSVTDVSQIKLHLIGVEPIK